MEEEEQVQGIPAIPLEEYFTTSEYVSDSDFTAFCNSVRRRYAPHLNDVTIKFLWKANGGVSNGRLVLGRCVKSSGLVKFYSNTKFTIWLGADHWRLFKPTKHQLEAAVFHELCHIVMTAEGVATIGHDVELFHAEVLQFGFWKADLKATAKVFHQQLEFEDLVKAAQSKVTQAGDGAGADDAEADDAEADDAE